MMRASALKLPAELQPGSNGTARRLRKNTESVPGTVVMTTVACYQCGAEFVIAHRSSSPDEALAARHAIWLADKFVWDHIRGKNHPGSIRLPGPREMK